MEDTRLESFPFDSKQAGYDDYGYPIYDRAVGASMLRQTFAKFFSNGVFDAPSNAFEISKGSGLKVNIAEGIAIINGAMASLPEGGIAVSLTDEATTAGTYAYGVFLRYDENSDKRSCYITVRKGEAGSSPTPPEPERSAPGIWELRLGYVVIPTGSSDLSSATVMNEKGLANCPFALPFEEIDLSSVTADAKASANEALTYLLDYFEQYKDMVAAAVDETLAGQLQTQITELKEQLENFDLSGSVDNKTIEYGVSEGEAGKTLHVKKNGIEAKHLAEKAAYENLQNASSSDFGKVKLADSENYDVGSEESTAVSPKGAVYAYNSYAFNNKVESKKSYDKYNPSSYATLEYYYPFNDSSLVEVSGECFSATNDSIVASKNCTAVFAMTFDSNKTGDNIWIKVLLNEEELCAFTEFEGPNSISLILRLSEGDEIKVLSKSHTNNGAVTINTLGIMVV